MRGTAIGISDEALASVEEVTTVATPAGGVVLAASRAGELLEGVAIEGKGEELEDFGGEIEERRRCVRWRKDVSLKMSCGEVIFIGCLKEG